MLKRCRPPRRSAQSALSQRYQAGPCRSMRPARSSSSRAICTASDGRPVARSISSTSTGAGPERLDDALERARRDARRRHRRRRCGRLRCRRIGGRVARQARASAQSARSRRSAPVTSVAPVLIRRLVPSARGSSGWPGTANTSRPCSAARRAVISVPERRAASTMTTPSEMPEMIRLRRGKSWARGSKPGGCSVTSSPLADLRAAARRARADRSMSMPPASTATVPLSSAASCAARVDAAGKARDDDVAGARRSRRRTCGRASGRRPSLARADDGDDRPREQVASPLT